MNYSAVEKRVATSVAMDSELQSRRNTQSKVSAKPAVAKVIADKFYDTQANQKFYGPQLPVQWAKDKSSMAFRKNKYNDDSDGEESPTEEVMRLLGGEPSEEHIRKKKDEEITNAYLQSVYSGSQVQRKSLLKIPDAKQSDTRDTSVRKLTVEEANFEFIGPQLQPDWTQTANENRHMKHKNISLRMDLKPGREEKKILHKGQIEITQFSEIKKDEVLGPGVYEPDNILTLGAATKGVVPFSKVIAREDLFGIHGEKPESAQQDLYDQLGDDLFYSERIDVDYSSAKDKAMSWKNAKTFKFNEKVFYVSLLVILLT